MTANKTTTKKSWRKPKLTVLVRGKPEEMVLVAGCKRSNGGGANGLTTACAPLNACNALGS